MSNLSAAIWRTIINIKLLCFLRCVPELLLSQLPKFIEFYLCIQMLPSKKYVGLTLAGPPCIWMKWMSENVNRAISPRFELSVIDIFLRFWRRFNRLPSVPICLLTINKILLELQLRSLSHTTHLQRGTGTLLSISETDDAVYFSPVCRSLGVVCSHATSAKWLPYVSYCRQHCTPERLFNTDIRTGWVVKTVLLTM